MIMAVGDYRLSYMHCVLSLLMNLQDFSVEQMFEQMETV